MRATLSWIATATQVATFGNNVSTNAAQDNNFAVGPFITSITEVTEIEDLGKHLSGKNDFGWKTATCPGCCAA